MNHHSVVQNNDILYTNKEINVRIKTKEQPNELEKLLASDKIVFFFRYIYYDTSHLFYD